MAESIVESSTKTVLNVAKTERIRVLHVDDDQAFLKVAKQCLDTQGEFEVDTASSVNEALEKLKKKEYDVVVSDYKMPDKDGLEFLKELREKGNTVPFVVFTGKGREEVAIEALNLGADQYLNKVGETETVYTELAHNIKKLARIRKTEEALRTSEEKHRVISSITADFVFSCVKADEEGFAIDWMAGATDKIFGYSAKEVKDDGCWKFTVQPQDLPTFEEKVVGLKLGQSSVCELRITHKDGSTRWLKVSSQVVKDSSNPANHRLFGACEDITERKKMDEEIKSLARFPSENPNSVLRISQDSRMLFVNDAGKGLLKKLNCEVGGSVPTFLKNLTVETLKSKSRRSDESEIEGRIYGFYAMPIVDKGYVNVYVIDITERRKAQDILKESEAKYRTLVEQSLQGIVIAQGPPPHLAYANPALGKITGYKADELTSLSPKELEGMIHPEDREMLFKRFADRLTGKRVPSRYEFRALRKDGTTAWVEISSNRIEYHGKPAVQATFIEITDRKQATEKAERVSEEWKKTFDAISDFMFILDTDFRFVRVNKAICDALKKEPSELIGKRCFEVLHGTDKPWPNCPYKETFVTKKATTEEVNDPNFDFPLLVTVSPIFDDKGEFFGVVHIAKDITKLKDTEQHLKKVNERLEVMNEKLHVVGGLTRHDVRNKLSAVTGNAYLLRRKLADNPEALEQLADIEAAVRLVERIFEFAGTYEKLGVEQLASIDVGRAVDEAKSLVLDLENVRIVNKCGGLTVLADSLLTQLFYNLIENSLKHGEKTRQIKIYYKTPSADQLELVCEDDGVGMSEDVKGKIFGKGYTTGKGSGYGLFMAKRICEVYGWTIRETGKQGKGAQFTMSIPRIDSIGKAKYRIQNP
jgi:PAS domain S-box-containing protein